MAALIAHPEIVSATRRFAMYIDNRHDAMCESCDRPLFSELGDEWEIQMAQDADGETESVICAVCINMIPDSADQFAMKRLA